MQKHTKMRKNTQNINKSTREHIMMTCPGFLALAVMLALTVALALAGPNTRDMSSLLRCSQCKNHRQKQFHSQSQKTGTCHHVVWAPRAGISKAETPKKCPREARSRPRANKSRSSDAPESAKPLQNPFQDGMGARSLQEALLNRPRG